MMTATHVMPDSTGTRFARLIQGLTDDGLKDLVWLLPDAVKEDAWNAMCDECESESATELILESRLRFCAAWQ